MLLIFLVGMIVRLIRAGYRIIAARMRRARFLFYLNVVAPADAAGPHDPAQHAVPPAKLFLKSLADFVQ
jgi:hypothetical protein